MKKLTLIPILMLLAACQQEPASEPAAVSVPPELTAVFQPVPGSEASSIPEVRQQAKPGDEVVIAAKVMGTMKPFVDGRALMVLGDEATLVSCDLMGDDDHCATPWDLCCEPREAVLEGTATVQVVDADGKVLAADLKGVKGLKELSRLRVKGVVAPQSTEQAFVINATAVEILSE